MINDSMIIDSETSNEESKRFNNNLDTFKN